MNNVENNATGFIALWKMMSSRIVSKDPNIPFDIDQIYWIYVIGLYMRHEFNSIYHKIDWIKKLTDKFGI